MSNPANRSFDASKFVATATIQAMNENALSLKARAEVYDLLAEILPDPQAEESRHLSFLLKETDGCQMLLFESLNGYSG